MRASGSRLWITLICAVIGTGFAVSQAAAQDEHLPSRTKPPPPGVRPSALPPYGVRLGAPVRSDADAQFDRIVDEILLFHLRMDPVRATNAGVHDFDALLPATDRAVIDSTTARLDGFLVRLAKLDVDRLGRDRRFDQALLTNRLRGILLDLRTIQAWKRDPSFYPSIAWEGIHSLLERDFAPREDRVWNVIARLVQIPRVLRDARANLENPPRELTEIAIRQAAELVHFLANELPTKVAPLRDPVQGEEFDHHLASVAGAANDYYDWLRHDLLPRSHGPLSLGADTYAQKLLLDESIATPLDSLFRRGEAALRDTQHRMEREGSAIGTGLSLKEALAQLRGDAPPAAAFVPATEEAVVAVRGFMAGRPVLTPPAQENLRVTETPAFLRPFSFASLDPPGVLETGSTEALFYVTPPDDRSPSAGRAEPASREGRVRLELVSIHEALPGRYAQSLALRDNRSLVRALFGTASSSEGWAHYCEEMMIEEGYGARDPRYRLAQLDRSLTEICHLLVAISLHARGGTYEDAVRFFEREAYLTRPDAEREARRNISETAGPAATLGKWGILDLRKEFQEAKGESFGLREFHDRFLGDGGAPIALVRDDWKTE